MLTCLLSRFICVPLGSYLQETEKLEDEKAALQDEIASLLSEKEQLELILAAHKPACKIVENLEVMLQDSIRSPTLLQRCQGHPMALLLRLTVSTTWTAPASQPMVSLETRTSYYAPVLGTISMSWKTHWD